MPKGGSMAEGPVVHGYASRLDDALGGSVVQVEFGIRKLKPMEADFDGVRLERVEAKGKQFHILFADGRAILVHLLMWGSWGIYRRGERWEKPRKQARLVLRNEAWEAVAFSAPIIELMRSEELSQHPRWGDLGPDPLRQDFDAQEAIRRLEGDPARKIGPAILDQRVIAGVGNILKNEILFRAGVHPRRTVADLSAQEKRAIVRWAVELCETWLKQDGRQKDWICVYRRSDSPCARCGTEIEFFRLDGRITYACPSCQPLDGRGAADG